MTGKGANNIISKLHYFLSVYEFEEEDVYLHADNCTGQNKINAMVHYLAWRVMTGLHRNITLSFLVVGHTKFSPDWCFGLFKKKFRVTKVGSLTDIERVVDDSIFRNSVVRRMEVLLCLRMTGSPTSAASLRWAPTLKVTTTFTLCLIHQVLCM